MGSGWKGIAGGIGLLVYAVAGAMAGLFVPDAGFGLSITEAIPVFLAGLGIFGVRLAIK